MTIENLLLFTSISLVATLTPGPAILLVTTNSVRYGLRSSILTMLGNISGLFLMSLLAVLGLSTMLLMSTYAFTAVKALGAVYLVYLGIRLWQRGLRPTPPVAGNRLPAQRPPGRTMMYLQGLMVALSNPKAIMFTTALFPQFIDASEPLALQFSILVSVFMLLSFSCLLGYAALAAESGSRAQRLGGANKLAGRLFGSVFIGSGIALALTARH